MPLLGTIAAFDLPSSFTSDKMKHIKQQFMHNGLLLRPLGNTIYLMPPYCTSDKDLEEAYDKIEKILKKQF